MARCAYISVLQRVAVCCSVLQCVAVRSRWNVAAFRVMIAWCADISVLQCVAVRCNVLQCVAVRSRCSELRQVAVCCSVLQ